MKDIEPQPLSFYQSFFKYDVTRDYEDKKNLKLLFDYKKKVLLSNGFSNLVNLLHDTSPQFYHNKYDEDGLEIAVDVDDVYPVNIEDEKNEILLKVHNMDYLNKSHHNFEYCRTRCKITDQRLRNFTTFQKEKQMCVTDCMNLRTELFNKNRPGNDKKEKNFIWLA